MHELIWQKSTYSAEAANCLYVTAAPTTNTVHLYESDASGVILTTSRAPLCSLIRALKAVTATRQTNTDPT